jgi:hypothetical protein
VEGLVYSCSRLRVKIGSVHFIRFLDTALVTMVGIMATNGGIDGHPESYLLPKNAPFCGVAGRFSVGLKSWNAPSSVAGQIKRCLKLVRGRYGS